ncbi:unnamed protein product [Phaedon cochleariae]|uniref:Tetratricopeptide repeat protein 25 n=1 Tax=Phaedon cochleariae TaxID=80249 RepID=A0A9P0DHR1_PHACE|nr:unnamed protein product [Phaedon cochleariae]
MGVMHCTNAIENCLGERAGRPLRDHFKIVRKLAWKRNYEAQKPFEPKPKQKKFSKKKKPKKVSEVKDTDEPVMPKTKKHKKGIFKEYTSDPNCLSIADSLHSKTSEKLVIPPYEQSFLFSPMQKYTTNIDNYMAEKYLDSMYLDKIFLKKLQKEPGAACPNRKGSMKIQQLAKNGFKTVSYKQELLRTRRPFYYIKYQEARLSGTLETRQAEELTLQQQNLRKEADALLGRLINAAVAKKLKTLITLTEKMKHYCDSKPKRLLPEKEEYIRSACSLMRRGFYETNRLNPTQYGWDQEKRIYIMMGLPISREPSSDSIIQELKNVFVDYKKQIATFEERLQHVESNDELCWCFHELARYHSEMKKWELARVYSRKCIQEGSHKDNWEWVVNATMLLVKIDIQQHNKNDAKNEINCALDVAAQLNDRILKEYLEKCLTVIDKIEFDDIYGPKVLEQREKRILAMMSNGKMKDEFAHLFRMMAAMPASRRMSVMPGIRVQEMGPSSNRKQSSRKQSILPADHSSRDSTPALPKKSMKDQDKDARGVGFMELVQYHV